MRSSVRDKFISAATVKVSVSGVYASCAPGNGTHLYAQYFLFQPGVPYADVALRGGHDEVGAALGKCHVIHSTYR